ncbi:hypothetical protein GOBAR_DD34758 [Gossypium barbadense]|nr:hypothetical protein GOBAR_DD34758 [Gossypium barbadense]
MAGEGARVLATPTSELGKILSCMHGHLPSTLLAMSSSLPSYSLCTFQCIQVLKWRGLVASEMVFVIQIYVVDRGGPLFVSMYLPLQTLLAALIAVVTLGEEFYLGGVVGAALIIAGLYLVVLGKSEESKYLSENEPIYSVSKNNNMESTFIRPLLGNKLQS